MAPDESKTRVLFCPFCRESFEGETECPEHELALVEFDQLPRQAHERAIRWDQPVAMFSPHYGRGFLLAGIACAFIGFLMPLIQVQTEEGVRMFSAFQVANSRAPNLWTVPFIAAMFLMILYRRRTLLQLRGSRLAALALALMPGASLAYSLANVARAARQSHGAMLVEHGPGVWVIAAASILFAAGAIRLGHIPAALLRQLRDMEEASPALDGSQSEGEPRPHHRRKRRRGR